MNIFKYLLIIICVYSCNVKKETSLSEKEQYEILNKCYTVFLDSMNRKKELYFRFAVLEDSLIMDNLLYGLEGKNKDLLIQDEGIEIDDPIVFEDSISNQLLHGFSLYNSSQVDSIKKSTSDGWFSYPIYSITRPYQPDTCSMAISQLFEVPHATGCIRMRCRYIVFKKTNNDWKYWDNF